MSNRADSIQFVADVIKTSGELTIQQLYAQLTPSIGVPLVTLAVRLLKLGGMVSEQDGIVTWIAPARQLKAAA